MPPTPRYKIELEEFIKRGIRNNFSETPTNNILVAELQSEIHRLLQNTDLARALKSVFRHNILPIRVNGPGSRVIPLEYRIATRNYGIIFEIIDHSAIPSFEYLLTNVFLININHYFYLKVTRLAKPPGLPVPAEWFFA